MKKSEFIYTFPSFVVDFLNYYSVIKNRSELTVTEYATDLQTFFRFLKVIRGKVSKETPFNEITVNDLTLEDISSVTLSDAYMFLVYCKDNRGNNERTRARKATTLRTFYKFLTVQKKLIDENPLQELDSPKIKKSLPKYLTLDESIALLNAVDGKYKERDYCIITLFLNCGMRLAELVGINITDIQNDKLTVIGKGGKERTIYLNEACLESIKTYIPVRNKIKPTAKDRNALFLSERGCRISRRTVQYTVEKYVKKIGLDPHKYTTHKLRHTAATLMHQSGVDIRVLQEILGHKQLSTTEIYTHVSNDSMRDAVKNNRLSSIKNKDSNQ